MHVEFEAGVNEQNRLLLEMVTLDHDSEDFEKQFDQVVTKLIEVTKGVDHLMQTDPGLRRALAP